ncbi:hypothetical protein BpHYR1_006705 [Brachionus plicatilis]|uniref:Uncharacterized protein n=1 Tax=Brachionus plicatilis TaxID=10195 RepID=A0A3M7RR63_BRAPC|nr:hypothetical protein BpHYR1_006705 [Brachionus plicatilis]
MIDLEEKFNESSIEDRSLSANEIGIEETKYNSNQTDKKEFTRALKSDFFFVTSLKSSQVNDLINPYLIPINCQNWKCPARMHLHFIDEKQNVKMLRNQKDHDHGFNNSSKRMKKEIKDKILRLFDIKTKMFSNIRDELIYDILSQLIITLKANNRDNKIIDYLFYFNLNEEEIVYLSIQFPLFLLIFRHKFSKWGQKFLGKIIRYKPVINDLFILIRNENIIKQFFRNDFSLLKESKY